MVVIDVNTGKFIGKGGNLEETVTKNNLEAAEEIARQLRLRDLGGNYRHRLHRYDFGIKPRAGFTSPS